MDTNNLKIPILTLVGLTVVGTFGFHIIEGVNLVKSLYWTIVTITTVGYGDVVPKTDLGIGFSIALMTIGIGTILYVLTAIGKNIVEGKVWGFLMRSEKEEEVEKLEDHLIVCGYGDLGQTITQELLLGNEDILIVDKNENVLREKATDLPYVVGNATSEEVLERAKVSKARGLFAALTEESENVLLTLIAKDINPDIRIITKADTSEGAKHLRRAGAEAIVLPEREGGIRMARSFLHPEITSLYDHLLMGNVGRAGTVKVPKDGYLDGVTIKDSKIRNEVGVSIMAIKRGEEIITNPKLDKEIKGGDSLIVIGTLSEIKKLRDFVSEAKKQKDNKG